MEQDEAWSIGQDVLTWMNTGNGKRIQKHNRYTNIKECLTLILSEDDFTEKSVWLC